jgi:alkaline phosphatase
MIRRPVRWVLLATLSVLCISCDPGPGGRPASSPASTSPPNVVFFVGDGFGVGAWGVGRAWAKHLGVELVLDEARHVGFLETQCADALVTDSAAAATAWSTGRLGIRNRVGDERADPIAPLGRRLKEAGVSFGFVTTARVTHATPAPFYGNVPDRDDDEAALAPQLVEAAPVVAIGGGRRFFLPAGAGGRRSDARNLLEEAEARGTRVLEEWSTPLPTDGPVLALLNDSHLPQEPDRGNGPDLAELTRAAIVRLEAEGKPWFLLVEEGRIDSACHDHDAPSLAKNVLRLDRAVRAVLESVDLDRTLVVVGADHATDSPTITESARVDSFEVVTRSVEDLEARIFGGKPWKGTPRALGEHAVPILDEFARQTDLDPETLDRLVVAGSYYDRRTAIGEVLSRRFGVVWMPYEDHLASTVVHGHTGEPVPLRAWGVRSGEVAGIRNHAVLGGWLADVAGIPPVVPTASEGPAVADSSRAASRVDTGGHDD